MDLVSSGTSFITISLSLYMKKVLFFTALLLLASGRIIAQSLPEDSVRRLLRQNVPDTSRSDYLSQLGFYLIPTNRDSALLLAQEGLAIANRLGYIRGQATNLNTIASVFMYNGDNARALEMLLDVLRRYESVGGDQRMVAVLINIGFVYGNMNDQQKSLEYTKKARVMAEKSGDQRRLTSIYINLGDIYEKLDQLDSARLYTTMGHELSLKLGRMARVALALGNMGTIYLKRHEYDLALNYYRLAIQELKKNDADPAKLSEIYIGMARTFNELKKTDSTLYYARLAYQQAAENFSPQDILNSSDYLYQYYKKAGRTDSAFYYREVSLTAKDSLFSEEKERTIQRLTFDEQVRQQELVAAENQRAYERRQNIQYAIAAIGLVCFLVLALLLARSVIVNESWIRFLGILGLLLVFEFINLFIHPFLATITGHSPLLMLLAMVMIAAVLIPLHHRLEHLVIRKLTRRNKAIRLEAARKTVARLEKEEGQGEQKTEE